VLVLQQSLPSCCTHKQILGNFFFIWQDSAQMHKPMLPI